ncbi:MAG: YARHG domain-containing protein [Lachnospiraceae bacterium]|nr:YARHG domain-containing protein [Lachnospiraceae bacterium]
MFCRKCGAELADGYAFCSKCGTPVINQDQSRSGIEAPKAQEMNSPKADVKAPKASGKMLPILLVMIAVFILAAIVVTVLFLMGIIGSSKEDDDGDRNGREASEEIFEEEEDSEESRSVDDEESKARNEAESGEENEDGLEDGTETEDAESMLEDYKRSLKKISLDGVVLNYLGQHDNIESYYCQSYSGDTGYLYSESSIYDGEPVVYSLKVEKCTAGPDGPGRNPDYHDIVFEAARVIDGQVVSVDQSLGNLICTSLGDDYFVDIYIKDNYVIYYHHGVWCTVDGEGYSVYAYEYNGNGFNSLCRQELGGSDLMVDEYTLPSLREVSQAYEKMGLYRSSKNALEDYHMTIEEEYDNITPVYCLDADNPLSRNYEAEGKITLNEGTHEKPAKGETQSINESEYILPGSASGYLSRSELERLTDEELRLARNELYARHGRKFNSEDLQRYFASKSWYTPRYEPEEFDREQERILNDYEIHNRDLIVEVENAR